MNGKRLRASAVGVLLAFLTVQQSNRLAAQHFTLGPQLVFGDYREVSADLHYRGVGGGLMASASWKKLSAEAVVSKVTYKPAKDGTATLEFDARELDVRLRYYIGGPVSGELGFISREVDPEFEAQSLGAVTAGARMNYLLGPGVHMGLNGGLIFAPKFSGGGKASPIGAFTLGLGLAVDGLRGRLRLTGDYDFQRITRKTNDGSGDESVPIQQSLGRVGVAVAF